MQPRRENGGKESATATIDKTWERRLQILARREK
jgi:hypothetical protein